MRPWIEYLFYRLLAAGVPLLPRRALVLAGRGLGTLYALFDARGRRVAKENLARFLPDHDSRYVRHEGARLQTVALLDALWSRRLTPKSARRYLEIAPEDEQTLRECRDAGHGIVLASAHFGSWEMLNVAAGAIGLPRATVVARKVRNPLIDRHLRRQRERTGNTIVYREEAMLACFSALKRGELVCSVVDMAVLPAEGGVFAEFFGLPAMTSGALPFFAFRRGAPFYLILAQPLDKGLRYRVRATKIPIDYEGDRDEQIRKATAALNRALESEVRRQPEAWIWNYKRWKWRPSEHRGPYPSYSYWVTKH